MFIFVYMFIYCMYIGIYIYVFIYMLIFVSMYTNKHVYQFNKQDSFSPHRPHDCCEQDHQRCDPSEGRRWTQHHDNGTYFTPASQQPTRYSSHIHQAEPGGLSFKLLMEVIFVIHP